MIKYLVLSLVVLLLAGETFSQQATLKNSGIKDWARYSISISNLTDQVEGEKKTVDVWYYVDTINSGTIVLRSLQQLGSSRIANGIMMGTLNDFFVPGLALPKTAAIEYSALAQEDLSLNGKEYSCTKLVRRISVSPDTGVSDWNGTSTVWLNSSVPFGILRIENDYIKDARHMQELWVLSDCGFGNWK